MNKKGISEMVEYILLVSLAVAMSGVIYAWLNFYVQQPMETQDCPDVSLTIVNHSCAKFILNVTVQNTGKFDVTGYLLRINNGGGYDYGLYPIGSGNIKYSNHVILPSKTASDSYNFREYFRVTDIEIEPVRGFTKDNRLILCNNAIVRIKADNSTCPLIQRTV